LIRKARALVGYLPRDQAIQVISGGMVPQSETDRAAAIAVWERYRAADDSRPPIEVKSPVRELPSAYETLASEFQRRADVIQAFAPHQWSVAAIDLTVPILTFQSLVHTDDATQRVAGINIHDPHALFNACLPEPERVELPGGFDPSQNAFTVSSLNPNLRIASFELVDAAQPAGVVKRIAGFTLSLGSSHIQVAEYSGRWMIRDGYHRLCGLIALGATIVPCIHIKARTFEETGAARPGFFGYEVLYSDRPPQLTDFLDERLSLEVTTAAVRKVVRIRAEEFVVPV
jgi:hypothetical protein